MFLLADGPEKSSAGCTLVQTHAVPLRRRSNTILWQIVIILFSPCAHQAHAIAMASAVGAVGKTADRVALHWAGRSAAEERRVVQVNCAVASMHLAAPLFLEKINNRCAHLACRLRWPALGPSGCSSSPLSGAMRAFLRLGPYLRARNAPPVATAVPNNSPPANVAHLVSLISVIAMGSARVGQDRFSCQTWHQEVRRRRCDRVNRLRYVYYSSINNIHYAFLDLQRD